MNIAQPLRKLMDDRKLSNSKLAREIGVHTSTVSNWLDGKEVKAENLAALCSYFECSLDYLAGTTEETKKAPTEEGERAITMDDFTYAMQNEAKSLTDMDKQILLSMAKQLNDARKKKDGESGEPV